MDSSPSTSTNISKSLLSNYSEERSSSQESGWTMYLEDFFNSSHEQSTTTSYYYNNATGGTSVIISDAASSSNVAYCNIKSKKKLSFKKKKKAMGGGGALDDDDSLEDTASSPVNSPKIGDMDAVNMNPRKKDDHGDLSQEKEVCFQDRAEMRRDGFGFVDGAGESVRTGLKKRGLCLVPLSMFVDYHG